MKWVAAVALLVFAGQAAAALPRHVMSLKVCTDELLLDLVPPSRIASVTFLSREPASLRVWPAGAAVPVDHNTAEEILAAPPAETFEDIRAITRMVAKAVGEEARGEALIARMDADLRDVAAHRPD